MITIEHGDTYGWEAAVRGMRNPKNSWNRSDSIFDEGYIELGENDLELMLTLANAGPDHGKFLRMIGVSCDITGPLYWWKEMDTYKVGTVADSCSTMHKIAAKEFELSDFSNEHLTDHCLMALSFIVDMLNNQRSLYLTWDSIPTDQRELFDPNIHCKKDVWWQMIQLLPSSYNQKRTWTANYAVLRNIYRARKDHKLDEWHMFCDWIKLLPYSELITGEERKG
mgnify:FL=1